MARYGLLLIFCVLLVGDARAVDLADGHAAMADYVQTKSEAETAYAAGNIAGYSAANTRAEERLREALAVYEALNAASGNQELRLAYVSALEAAQDYDLAAEILGAMLEEAPEDAALWRRLGKDSVLIGPAGQEPAFEALRRAIELSPDDAEAHYLMGNLFLEIGAFEPAREHITRAVELQPAHVLAQVDLAALNARAGRFLEASDTLDALGKAIQAIDPQVRVLLRDALSAFNPGAVRSGETAESYRAIGRLLYRAGRLPDALSILRQATERAPRDVETWNLAAAVALQLGDLPAARIAYQGSLAANPSQPAVANSLAELEKELAKQPKPNNPNAPIPFAN